jgi:hypothetical protein
MAHRYGQSTSCILTRHLPTLEKHFDMMCRFDVIKRPTLPESQDSRAAPSPDAAWATPLNFATGRGHSRAYSFQACCVAVEFVHRMLQQLRSYCGCQLSSSPEPLSPVLIQGGSEGKGEVAGVWSARPTWACRPGDVQYAASSNSFSFIFSPDFVFSRITFASADIPFLISFTSFHSSQHLSHSIHQVSNHVPLHRRRPRRCLSG